MTKKLENLEKMLAIWNTPDVSMQRALAGEALESNVHFVDPNHNIIGPDAFLAMVAEVQSRIPGAAYSRKSGIDVQHNFCRYHWAIDFQGSRLVDGFDVSEVNDAGRIVKVIGFFGRLVRND